MHIKTSRHYTPQTPYELQREAPESVWTTVGYYAAMPDEADEPGYRAVRRDAAPKAKKTKGA